jgi:putative nucleotidyltransferase with HDIG domain
MKKQIGINQLRLGMRIEKMDRSWLATPFLRRRMVISSAHQIEQLKACGVQTLEVTTDDSGETEADCGEGASFAQPSAGMEFVPEEAPPSSPAVPFEEELPAARQVYKAAKTIIEGAMHDVRMGRAINMDAVNQVVSEMTDSVFRNPDALTSLSRLKRFDEYTFFHSVNTSLLAMSLGRNLGFDRPALHQIGVGTLLHDIGKTKVPIEILNKPGRFEPHEMEIMKQHVIRGAEVLSGTTGLGDTYLKPTLEHHERIDGSGYPYQRSKADLSQFGLIAAVVDIYDAITSDRCYHKAKPAHEALQFLYLISQKGHLDHALVQRFIQVVGVYPVGTVVELNTGEIAIVRRIHHEAPLEPIVFIVKSAGNVLVARPEEHDLLHQTQTPHRTIATVKDPLSSGLNPSIYLDKESL